MKFFIFYYFFFLIKYFLNIKINKIINIKGFYKKINLKYININKKFFNFNFKKYKNLIYFGYSNCPDICPKLINKIIYKLKNLKIFYKINFLFISIDLKRDSIEILQKYLNKFKKKNIYSIIKNKYYINKISKNLKIFYIIFKKFFNKLKINHANILYLLNKNKIINKIN